MYKNKDGVEISCSKCTGYDEDINAPHFMHLDVTGQFCVHTKDWLNEPEAGDNRNCKAFVFRLDKLPALKADGDKEAQYEF